MLYSQGHVYHISENKSIVPKPILIMPLTLSVEHKDTIIGMNMQLKVPAMCVCAASNNTVLTPAWVTDKPEVLGYLVHWLNIYKGVVHFTLFRSDLRHAGS